jgi:hypothetical protein
MLMPPTRRWAVESFGAPLRMPGRSEALPASSQEEIKMSDGKLKMEIAVPKFFALPMKKVEVESAPFTGRTYFILDGRIVGVARRMPAEVENA